jgi:hypothetical protein
VLRAVCCVGCLNRGYSQNYDGQDCTPCPSESGSIAGTVGYTLLIAVAVLLIFAFVWRSAGVKTKRFTPWEQDKNWTPEDRSPPNYTYNFKILLSFFQIASTLFDLVEIPWPTAFQQFIQYFSFGPLLVPSPCLPCA